jgi:thioredoxin reductase (NADPH)
MGKPVLFTIDDDLEVLAAVERDLRKQFGSRFRVIRADKGETALEALKQLKLRNEEVALFLSDQRMPGMTGVEFLEQAMEVFPRAKRVLLTAYADTDAAIKAINQVKIDYYLMKPWEPPEVNLYPVLDDLLDDWLSVYRPAFDGIRIVGNRWSPKTHQLKDFLSRNQIPFKTLDPDNDDEGKRLIEAAGNQALPMLLFPDGGALTDPQMAQVAEKVGLKTRAEQPFYDLIIVGAGPAGLAAAVYGASEGLRTVLIEREAPGGQAGTSSRIENYLGFPIGLSGADLARRAVAQARRFGVEIISHEVTGVKVKDPFRTVHLADGSEISSHAMMISTGVSYRKLEIPGVDKLYGAGVYYGAALTEALFCEGEEVYIVGGANSAGQAAMHFSRYARMTYMLVRGPSLAATMSQYLIDQIAGTPNIEVVPNSSVVEVHGESSLEAIAVVNSDTGEVKTVPTTALFIFIGAKPHTEWLGDLVERDEYGFILSGADLLRDGKPPKHWPLKRDPFLLETSVPGIFVSGDVRAHSVKRVASAVGEGSMGVQFIHKYLAEL